MSDTHGTHVMNMTKAQTVIYSSMTYSNSNDLSTVNIYAYKNADKSSNGRVVYCAIFIVSL